MNTKSTNDITLGGFVDALKEKIATQENVAQNNAQAIATLEQQLNSAHQTQTRLAGYVLALREQLEMLESNNEPNDKAVPLPEKQKPTRPRKEKAE